MTAFENAKNFFKETHSHYVYFLTMNDDNKVERMVKVWNASWAMRELGWIQ